MWRNIFQDAWNVQIHSKHIIIYAHTNFYNEWKTLYYLKKNKISCGLGFVFVLFLFFLDVLSLSQHLADEAQLGSIISNHLHRKSPVMSPLVCQMIPSYSCICSVFFAALMQFAVSVPAVAFLFPSRVFCGVSVAASSAKCAIVLLCSLWDLPAQLPFSTLVPACHLCFCQFLI